MSDIEKVFSHWNKAGIIKHRKLTGLMADAIQRRLEDLGLEDVLGAIDNYKDILEDENCLWTYKWTLREFLTRHRDNSKDVQDLQIVRFTPEEFKKESFMKKKAQEKDKQREVDELIKKGYL